MMTVTKASLIDAIYESCDCPKPLSAATVESLMEIIKKTLESGEDILISGFGRFCIKDKKERKGRNPETGDDMKLRARRIVTFKCSGVLKEKINGKG
jgi:integration host factor subunit alpha